MGQISESYASPGLRLGLMLEDNPGAAYDFRLAAGDEVGVPDEYGGAGKFCVCTITFPDGRPDVVAWKPVAAKGQPDDWNVLCTKTLGRALKRAGYPDDLHDLKALVLWRQREAEIAAIKAGALPLEVPRANTIAALPSADPMQAALDDAGRSDAEAVGVDEETGEVLELASDDERAELEELAAGLDAKERRTYDAFCASIGWDGSSSMTREQAELAVGWFDS